MVRNLKKVKNESHILEYWKYGEKTEKMWKMTHTHGRTGKIGTNSEKRKNEKGTL
jgi:hypothetical protein